MSGKVNSLDQRSIYAMKRKTYFKKSINSIFIRCMACTK